MGPIIGWGFGPDATPSYVITLGFGILSPPPITSYTVRIQRLNTYSFKICRLNSYEVLL